MCRPLCAFLAEGHGDTRARRPNRRRRCRRRHRRQRGTRAPDNCVHLVLCSCRDFYKNRSRSLGERVYFSGGGAAKRTIRKPRVFAGLFSWLPRDTCARQKSTAAQIRIARSALLFEHMTFRSLPVMPANVQRHLNGRHDYGTGFCFKREPQTTVCFTEFRISRNRFRLNMNTFFFFLHPGNKGALTLHKCTILCVVCRSIGTDVYRNEIVLFLKLSVYAFVFGKTYISCLVHVNGFKYVKINTHIKIKKVVFYARQ